jgi:hypothetical protein
MKIFPKVSGSCCVGGVCHFGKSAMKSAERVCKMKRFSPFCGTAVAPPSLPSTWASIGRQLCHGRYCLVCVDVGQYAAAAFVRRLLHHQQFDTEAKRLGSVIRLSQRGLALWRLHAEEEIHVDWSS